MAATLLIISGHGATITTTETDITGLTCKFKRADEDANDLVGKIARPASGSNFSWRKTMRLKATVSPAGDLSNLRFFSDATAWGTGITHWAHTIPVGEYTQASAADETAKIDQGGGSAVTNSTSFTSASPLVVNAGVVLTNPTTGYGTQDAVEQQVEVASTAAMGTTTARTMTYRVDES